MLEKNEFIQPGEWLEDLQLGGLQILQRADLYRFAQDAVLLADFATVKNGERVCDLGSGAGVICLLLAGNSAAREIVGVEIQPALSDMAARSVLYNGIGSRVKMLNMPMQEAHTALGCESMDAVVCNPPYRKTGTGDRSAADAIAIARHEVYVTLDEVAASAARLLKLKGRFYMIHRCDRLADVFRALSAHRLEPKTLKIVRPAPDKDPLWALVEAVKGGKAGLKVIIGN
ncbi:SAM-dependent methyltransferase [Clostridia bacterium]|nr:SAM-dependent methyltransferase [Clostridia bacterium]